MLEPSALSCIRSVRSVALIMGHTTEHSLADSHLLLERTISQIPDRQKISDLLPKF